MRRRRRSRGMPTSSLLLPEPIHGIDDNETDDDQCKVDRVFRYEFSDFFHGEQRERETGECHDPGDPQVRLRRTGCAVHEVERDRAVTRFRVDVVDGDDSDLPSAFIAVCLPDLERGNEL